MLAAGTRIGPYEVLDVAGKGGMGVVYRARDTRLGRLVALKVLPADVSADPDRRKRLEQEARVISSLSEPHICTLYDVGNENGVEYLVMEFLEGETLQDRLRSGPLPFEQVLRYGSEIAGALAKAHRMSIVHRDLKPGNIMLTKAGAKLLDFGLARFVKAPISIAGGPADRATETLRLTSEGAILGTWQYMAPEQAQGQDADARTDIFALGAVLYEMATGHPAFTGKSKASLIANLLTATPGAASAHARSTGRVSAAFDRLVQRCLEKDPDERWQSAKDLGRELDWIASGASDGDVASAGQRQRPLLERAAMAVAGVTTVAFLGLLYFFLRGGQPPVPATVRLSIVPPPHTSIRQITLSPDGKRLAFTVAGPANALGLWIRPLDSAVAQLVPGTSGALAPFWSPDSRYVAFVEDGKLKRVEAGGSAPEVLCQVPMIDKDPQRPAWNSNNVVLLSPELYKPMLALDLGDCSVRTAIELDAARKEISSSLATFLPDGRHFLFVANRLIPEKGVDIDIGTLGAPQRQTLVHNASMPSYVPPGYLVFAREGKLLAQSFDASTLRLAGEPFPIAAERARSNHFNGWTNYAIASGTLVYAPDVPTPYQLQWRGRDGKSRNLGEPDVDRLFQLSPDGHTALMARLLPDTGSELLWTYDTATNLWRRFSFTDQIATEACWGPDGREIVYLSHRNNEFGLYKMAADGTGQEETLLTTPFWRAPRSLSRDRRHLLFENYEAGTGFDLWLLTLGGGAAPAPLVKTPFSEGNGVFSPDGAWVAYMSNKSGRFEVYVQAFPPNGQEWKVSAGVAGFVGGTSRRGILWRADGKELYYTADDWQEMAVPISTAHALQAGVPVPLFRVPPDSQVDATADGQQFLVNAPVESAVSGLPLSVVLHWTAEHSAD
jgi:Tol biopolymer transport system component/predicted Ser/Thr protein kinase